MEELMEIWKMTGIAPKGIDGVEPGTRYEEESQDERTEEDSIYLHIQNGGIEISAYNDEGLTLEVKATHFGNITNCLKVHTDAKSLRKVGEILIAASEKGYPEGFLKATWNEPNSDVSPILGSFVSTE